uniref:CUB domain-containing protein n=1 Tax=Rhabditophanes sp. KR3021 TaxID=114890 RepID=A0AC35TVE3_9BILA
MGEYFWTDGSVFNYSLSGLSNDPNRCFALRTNVQINNFVELHGSQAQPFICKQQASFCPASSYTNAFGKLTSSNYPGNYENNLDCKYSIVVAPGNRVEFNLRYFQSEPTYDYLSVIDGPDVDGVLLSTYSGDLGVDIENYQIISSSNSLTLVFFSDFAHNFKGWTADYQSLPMDKTQIINGISGVLSSPNFPKNYPAFAEELYVITSPVNTRINFVVDTVWLAQHYASISFYDGPSQSYPKLNKFMGHLVDSGMTSINFKSTQNVVTVYFLSEDLIADKGWHFSWSAEYF